MVKYLRFRNYDPYLSKQTYMPMIQIAKFLNKSTAYVGLMCKKIIADAKPQPKKAEKKKDMPKFFDKFKMTKKEAFSEEMKEYLLKTSTLNNWASKSLEERVALLRRRYPATKCTVYQLRKLYAKHKVRKKVIREIKVPNRRNIDEVLLRAHDLA